MCAACAALLSPGEAKGFSTPQGLQEKLICEPLLALFLQTALDRALALYEGQAEWMRIVRRGMQTDVSWQKSAASYVGLYASISDLS